MGVFLAYASARGRAFLDRALYLPKEWAGDAGRRAEAGVPPGVRFATKGQLAKAMLARAFAAEVPAAWVTGDEVYGDDGHLRRWLEEQRRPYVLAVSRTHRVWRQGRQEQIDRLVADLPAEAWVTLSAGEGSQGPRLYDWAWGHLPYVTASGTAQWVLVRRSLSDPSDLAYYRAYGPEDTPVEELVRVAGTRWIIEESFERAKGAVGLDDYEVRRWEAWYRHITLALLAHAYLEVTRLHATMDEEAGKGGPCRHRRSDSADGTRGAPLVGGPARAGGALRLPLGLVPLAVTASSGRATLPPGPAGAPLRAPLSRCRYGRLAKCHCSSKHHPVGQILQQLHLLLEG